MCIKLVMLGKLTPKQRKFFQHYCKYHNLAAAAKFVKCKCNSLQSFSTQGHEILKSLELSMPELLDAEGLSDEAMAKPLQDGLIANKSVFATWEGKFTDEKVLEDHPTRLKATELLGRMKGVFIDRVNLSGRDGGDIILQVKVTPGKKGPKSIDLDID